MQFSVQESSMSAKKLGRLAGFVLVLAAMFGGVGAASVATAYETGDSGAVTTTLDSPQRLGDIVWV
jgi:hypothetical protein